MKPFTLFLWVTALVLPLLLNAQDFLVYLLHRQASHRHNQPTQSPKIYVVFSADVGSFESLQAYAALAPLTSFVWRHVHGVVPLLLLSTRAAGTVSTREEEFVARVVRRAGGRVLCVHVPDLGDDIRTATAMQVGRLAAPALRFLQPDDVLLTSDADIWPLSSLFWRGFLAPSLRPLNETVLIYNGEFFLRQHAARSCEVVTMTLLGAKVRVWRRILREWAAYESAAASPRACKVRPLASSVKISAAVPTTCIAPLCASSLSFEATVKQLLEAGRRLYGDEVWARAAHSSVRHNEIWLCDQLIASEMLHRIEGASSSWCPGRCSLNLDLRRLDKGSWTFDGDIAHYTDAHLNPLAGKLDFAHVTQLWSALFGANNASKAFLEDVLEEAVGLLAGKPDVGSPGFEVLACDAG